MTTTLKARLAATGIKGNALAKRLGVRANTVSDHLTAANPSPRLVAEIEAVEIMTPEQRVAWLRAG